MTLRLFELSLFVFGVLVFFSEDLTYLATWVLLAIAYVVLSAWRVTRSAGGVELVPVSGGLFARLGLLFTVFTSLVGVGAAITIGHALEASTDYSQFLHGEAVAWGMIAAAAIARESRTCNAETAERITAATRLYGPLPRIEWDVQNLLDRLIADKKTVAGALHFVLPQKIGKVKISNDVPASIVRHAVELIRNHA